MTTFRLCMLLLVNAAAGLLSVSGAGITLKYVCPGDSVQAFQNIDFDRCNAIVSLHINGKRNTEIATWVWRNCTLNETRIDPYKDRVFLDQNGTITIHNLHHFDQGKYVVISKKDILPSIKEVEIIVMVTPSKDCKPKIVRLGNKLIASLNDGDCGIPVPTLYWKGYGGVPDTNDSMLKITPETESRTYYACIQDPAVQCVKSPMPLDNCSPFIIEGNNSRTMSSESCSTAGFIGVIIVLVIMLSLAIVAIVILILTLKRRRRKHVNEEYTVGLLDSTRPGEEHFDPNLGTEKASTKHRPSYNSKPIKEIGLDAGICTFCRQESSAMFVLPCDHLGRWYMPACIKCGLSRGPCEQCMTSKRKYMEFATWTVLTDSARN